MATSCRSGSSTTSGGSELYVDEGRDGDLNRTVGVARFTEPTNPNADLLPPLHDVQLLTAKPDLFTLPGYEVSPSNGGKPVHYRELGATAGHGRADPGPRRLPA